jgi:hypothetical protein
LFGVLLVYFLFAFVIAYKPKVPEIINWRFTDPNDASYIETSFSNVINHNSPIKYITGRRKSESNSNEIKIFNLGDDGTIVWKLCDTVDINMMGMTALTSSDKHLNEKASKKGFDKVCRLINPDQLEALPAGSVYLLISDNRENIIASYIFNSDEMEVNQDKFDEYQKSYGLTLGAIVSCYFFISYDND